MDFSIFLNGYVSEEFKKHVTDNMPGEDSEEIGRNFGYSPNAVRNILARRTRVLESNLPVVNELYKIAIRNCNNTLKEKQESKKYFESLK